MLEKPDIPESSISACLQDAFGLRARDITFLPIGADLNTAVYRVIADGDGTYFLKLRSGVFDETSVALPKFLHDQGISQIIPPLPSLTGQLWSNLDTFRVILYPYVAGSSGFEGRMLDSHWQEFGAALQRMHTTEVPAVLKDRLRREAFSPRWRRTVEKWLGRVQADRFHDPVAVKMAAFLVSKRPEILDLVRRAEQLGQALVDQTPPFVLCHSDIHAGNVLLAKDGAFYIVDWDDPILAPKERDLMFIGAGIGGVWNTAREEALFYYGYGHADINPFALAYYRYERIVEDIAVYCEQVFGTDEGGDDREQSLVYLTSNFLPGGTIEIAYNADDTAFG